MSDDTTRPSTSGGDAIRSIDITSSKIQAVSLLVSRSGVESGLASRQVPMSARGESWCDFADALKRRDKAMSALVERCYHRRKAGASAPARQYAGGAFDPSSLPLTAWYRAPFAASPWVSSASVGPSVARGSMTEATNPPTAGTALNGCAPASFNGTTQFLANANTLGSFVSGSAWSIAVLVKPTATAIARTVGGGYNDPCILSETAQGYWYLTYTVSGVTVGHYDDNIGWVEANQACAAGAWHLVQAWFDGANISIAVDSVAATSTVTTVQILAAVGPLTFGKGGFGGPQFYTGDIAEVMISNSALDVTARSNIRAYVNTRYGLAL